MKKIKIVKINDGEALDHISRCEVYQALSDYEVWSMICLKNPSDEDAIEMMMDCEQFIMTDPRAERCIEDPVKLLNEIDKLVEKRYRKWVKQCSR